MAANAGNRVEWRGEMKEQIKQVKKARVKSDRPQDTQYPHKNNVYSVEKYSRRTKLSYNMV